jgi:hypothetical protein
MKMDTEKGVHGHWGRAREQCLVKGKGKMKVNKRYGVQPGKILHMLILVLIGQL